MFTKTIILAALAAFAVASPANTHNTHSGGDACGAGSTVHCCNAESAEQLVGDGLSLDVAEFQSILGQCNDVTVAVLGGAVPLKDMCKQQAVCCGDMEQSGVVNLGCTPINI